VRRRLRTPFTDAAGEAVLVHGAHHKVGTVWFQRVLAMLASSYGLRFEEVADSTEPGAPGLRPATAGRPCDVALYHRANDFDPAAFGDRPVRATHLVRDPRDVVVSGYHYHRRTDEAWARRPDERYGGRSYQDHLRSLDEAQGLAAEIEHSARFALADMASWDSRRPGVLELRYEDAVADEVGTFSAVFDHYGLDAAARRRGLDIVERYSHTSSSSALGPDNDPHIRSGRPGEWRQAFGAEHVALFKRLTGDLVVRLGYETTPDW
jgi:hypothetical protein